MSPRFCFEVWCVYRHRDSFLERKVYYLFPREEGMTCPADPREETPTRWRWGGGWRGAFSVKKQRKPEETKGPGPWLQHLQ